jgi:sulfite reductase alpha subunit-like flavoprotein
MSHLGCRGWIPALIFTLAVALPRQCCPATAGMAGLPATTSSNLGAAVPTAVPPLVLYGSETGTAEDVAWHIAGRMRARGLSPRCLAMDDFDVKELPRHRLIVCVAATAGDGAAPSNMRATWAALLRKDLPASALQGVDYAVFGLGDSGYAKFNAAARRLDVRLAQLGASRLLPAGMGNDQDPQGEDTALTPWLQSLWETLSRRKHLPLKVRNGIDEVLSQDNCSDLDVVDSAAAAAGAAAAASPLVQVDGGYDGRLQRPPSMTLEEAQEIVKSISSLSNTVLFSLGSPQAGGAASAESVSMAREIKAAGARLCFFDCLRSRRVAEALRVAGCQTPAVFVGGNPAARERDAAQWVSSGGNGVGEGGEGVGGGEQKGGGNVAGGMEGCLNDVWDGVGGAGHKWSSGALQAGSETSKPGWSLARVVSASRITADWIEFEGKDVRHLELSTAGDGCSYSPGDVALIMPRNRPSSVRDLLWTLELDGSAIVRSCDSPRELWGELPCTIEELVSANFDLDGPPR